MDQRLVLAGEGELALEVATYVQDLNERDLEGFRFRVSDVVTPDFKIVTALADILGYTPHAVGALDRVQDLRRKLCIICDVDPRVRRERAQEVRDAGAALFRLVHPTAYVARTAHLGPGCVIAPLVVVSPGAIIGVSAFIGAGSNIGSHAVVGDEEVIIPGTRRVHRGTGSLNPPLHPLPEVPTVEQLLGMQPTATQESETFRYVDVDPRDVELIRRFPQYISLTLKDQSPNGPKTDK